MYGVKTGAANRAVAADEKQRGMLLSGLSQAASGATSAMSAGGFLSKGSG